MNNPLAIFIYIRIKKQVSYIATKSSFILFVAMHTVKLYSYLVVLPRELHLHESQQKTLGAVVPSVGGVSQRGVALNTI